MSTPVPVRLHPEATDDPLTLRWVTDTVLTAPTAAMTELLHDGTLADLQIAPGEVRTRLMPGRSWSQDGPRVRSTLFQALSEESRTGGARGDDAVRRQIAEVLRNEVAPFVNSHGGDIGIVSLDDGTLTVSLDGTCGHCALRGATLRNVVANAVQSRFPLIRRVRAVRTQHQ